VSDGRVPLEAPVEPIDVSVVRKDFPLLARTVHDRPIVYLDSAASSLQPRSVLAAMERYYETTHANVHRGVYATAEEATALYEGSRMAVGRFVGAADPEHEIVFTKNATESINLVAQAWARNTLKAGDVVVVTEMEHHANLVPWLILAEQVGIELRYLAVDEAGRLDLSDLEATVAGSKLVAVTAMSNVLGTINPLGRISEAAHEAGALVLADGAQWVPHVPVDLAASGADFLAFSGHKMLGPTGIGVLWARRAILEAMPPFMGGGGMILDVRHDRFVPAGLPHRFEAGTPPIAEAVGLGAAVEYLTAVGMERIRAHERALTHYALDALSARFGDDCRVFGPPEGPDRGGVLSIGYRDIHAHDLAQILDQHGVCVRPGHHCAKPLMRKLGVPAAARASFGLFNDEEDVDTLIEGLEAAGKLFG
jgi:cysteine desulfurase/selenocysteine lyase